MMLRRRQSRGSARAASSGLGVSWSLIWDAKVSSDWRTAVHECFAELTSLIDPARVELLEMVEHVENVSLPYALHESI